MSLYDEGNIIPSAFKDYMGKIANKLIKAQITDLLKISSPSFIHSPITYVQGAANDVLLC